MNSLILSRCLAARSGVNAWQATRHMFRATAAVTNSNHERLLMKTNQQQQSLTDLISKRHSSNHSGLWSLERMVSAGLIGVIPIAFIAPSLPGVDYALALALVSHVHWGVEAIVVDYIRPTIFGPVLPKIMLGAVYLLSALALGGLFYFNYTDVGVTNGLRMAWKTL